MLQARAHAKINLFLHVTGRRPDGYHELDSLAVFAEAADLLTLEYCGTEQKESTLLIDGPFGKGLDPGADNLVLRAASALRAAAGRPDLPDWRIRLDKNLPVASGIGGGSADAAAALRLLASAWKLEAIDLAPIAATLGADVPVCLAQVTQRMQGIGEKLVDAPDVPRCAMLLVNPGVAVPTPSVFRAWRDSAASFRPAADLPVRWNTVQELAQTLSATVNDLQEPAIALYPVIGEVLQSLQASRSCLFARMSGSGATCFGLYADLAHAQAAAERMTAFGWWAAPGWVQTGLS